MHLFDIFSASAAVFGPQNLSGMVGVGVFLVFIFCLFYFLCLVGLDLREKATVGLLLLLHQIGIKGGTFAFTS